MICIHPDDSEILATPTHPPPPTPQMAYNIIECNDLENTKIVDNKREGK